MDSIFPFLFCAVFLYKYGAVVFGGNSPLVTPAGYILGGGHSPITRMKGLGVDQVVAFEIVTANGSIVHMTDVGKDFFKNN